MKIISFDLSLSSPGAAVVEVKDAKPTIVAVSHVVTNAKQAYAVRGKTIESWAHLFIGEHARKGFDIIIREKYSGKFGHHPIFTAHVAADRALNDFGLVDTEKPIAQQSVKKAVVGKGRAEKAEVEEAVRRLTGYSEAFVTDDESDAVAIALAWAVQCGLIENEIPKEDK